MDKNQEDKVKEQLQMSGYAHQVMSNPAYKNAMIVLRASIFDNFIRLKSNDTEGLKLLKLQLDSVEKFQVIFEKIMETGKLAERQLTLWEKAIKFKKGNK